MREQVKFALVATMLMTMAGISWLLPLRFIIEGGPSIDIVLSSLLSLAISAFSALYISHEHRNAREGYPLADERSKAVLAHAGNYAFFISAASVLLLFTFSLMGAEPLGVPEIQAGEILFATMVIMISVYLGVWTLLTFKWRLG